MRACHLMLALTLAGGLCFADHKDAKGYERFVREIRHELVMLPYYGVFDNLAYRVDGYKVTLMGQVTRPTLKSDAERVVKDIEGVEQVTNNIEVLPLSGFDDSIRANTYRALFGWNSPLFRYGSGVNPSIHIVVSGGHVTLEGVVSSEGDRRLAYMLANQVPGVFSVTNNLRNENARAR